MNFISRKLILFELIILTESLEVTLFQKCGANKKINVSPKETITSIYLLHCVAICFNYAFCDSILYNAISRKCQLLQDGRLESCDSFSAENNTSYWEISLNQPGSCLNGATYTSGRCECVPGWAGVQCQKRARDCTDVWRFSLQTRINKVYITTILPDGIPNPIRVACLNKYKGKTIIQMRKSMKDNIETFNRTWVDYKQGFGTFGINFWWGLDNIYHILSNQGKEYFLYVLVEIDSVRYFINYRNMKMQNESLHYKISLEKNQPNLNPLNAGDARFPSNEPSNITDGMEFSTWDKDNDISSRHCAVDFGAGWWFSDCGRSNLNGFASNDSLGNERDLNVPSIWWGSNTFTNKRVSYTYISLIEI